MVPRSEPPGGFGFDYVAVDSARQYNKAWQDWLVRADHMGVRVIALRPLLEAISGQVASNELSGLQIDDAFCRPALYSPWKRAVDVAVVLLVSPVVLPLLAVLYVISCTSILRATSAILRELARTNSTAAALYSSVKRRRVDPMKQFPSIQELVPFNSGTRLTTPHGHQIGNGPPGRNAT